MGLSEFSLSTLLGLLAIAATIYFGLRGIPEIKDTLSRIERRLITVGTTMDNAWDVLKLLFAKESGTVERDLKNFGKVKITAKPSVDETNYFIRVEKGVLEDGAIVKLSKETGLEEDEKRLFAGEVPQIFTPMPDRMRIQIPSANPELCTEYLSLLLRWLDSTYFDTLGKIQKDYEEPIKV